MQYVWVQYFMPKHSSSPRKPMDVPNKTMAATLKQFQWSLYLIQASRMRSTYDSMAAASELQAASHQERRQQSSVPHFGPTM